MRKFACVIVLLCATPLLAQNTDLESVAGLNFNFRNPGARALGMGGAFLALADDATAAETNPAGLTVLRQAEVSLEVRNFRSETALPATGDYPDLEYENFFSFSRNVEISFASAVFPRDKWAVAVYYHHPLQVAADFNMTYDYDIFNDLYVKSLPYYFIERGNPPGTGRLITSAECDALNDQELGLCATFQANPFITAVDVEQETWGLAGAWEFGRLSLGAGVRYQTFEQGALTLRYDYNLALLEALIQATELDEDGVPKTEDDITFTAGFKYALRDNLAIGGVVKQGAEYPTGVFQSVVGQEFDEAFPTTFHVPDTAGLGVAWRPLPVLALLADAVWIRYSNLTDDFRSAYGEIQILDKPYQIKDSVEYHVGGEYFFTSRIPVAIRAGWWFEPAHGLDYVGPITCTEPQIAEDDRVLCAGNRVRSEILFDGGEDQHHFTVGVGLAWPRFQIDAAYDTSDNFKVGSISGVFRF